MLNESNNIPICYKVLESYYLHVTIDVMICSLILFDSLHKQLLQHLHSENKLSKRFPIGLEDQIKKWDTDKIRKFHERWYFPANATLYIVGNIDNIPKTVHQIEVCLSYSKKNNVLGIAFS